MKDKSNDDVVRLFPQEEYSKEQIEDFFRRAFDIPDSSTLGDIEQNISPDLPGYVSDDDE